MSTRICDITIPGLPTVLTGHIVPKLTIASLIGIRELCNAGCTVTFSKKYCDVIYNGAVILRGHKDPSTDLWTLPLAHKPHATYPPADDKHVATFAYSITTRANKVKFAHQSLCNPKISKLIKATRKGFLKGCPNITEELILKYLNPSPATAKGHMKRPRHGLRSTTPKQPRRQPIQHPLRNPLRVTLINLEILGLHNDWCANFTLFARVDMEWANVATC